MKFVKFAWKVFSIFQKLKTLNEVTRVYQKLKMDLLEAPIYGHFIFGVSKK